MKYVSFNGIKSDTDINNIKDVAKAARTKLVKV